MRKFKQNTEKRRRMSLEVMEWIVIVIFVLVIIFVLFGGFGFEKFKKKPYEDGFVNVYKISESLKEGVKVYRNAEDANSICDFLEPGSLVIVENETPKNGKICYKLANESGYIFLVKDSMIYIESFNPN